MLHCRVRKSKSREVWETATDLWEALKMGVFTFTAPLKTLPTADFFCSQEISPRFCWNFAASPRWISKSRPPPHPHSLFLHLLFNYFPPFPYILITLLLIIYQSTRKAPLPPLLQFVSLLSPILFSFLFFSFPFFFSLHAL